MTRLAILLLSFLWMPAALAQEAPHTGRALWRAYDTRETGAMQRTYEMAFDDRGILYAANEAGLVSFDGFTWRVYEAGLKRMQLQSILPLVDGSWLAGGAQSLGIFRPTQNGNLSWNPILEQTKGVGSTIKGVTSLIPTETGPLVITDQSVSLWKNESLTQVYAGLPTGLSFHTEQGIIFSIEGGLVLLSDEKPIELLPPPGWNDIEPVSFFMSGSGETILLTKRSGLFVLSLEGLRFNIKPVWDILPPIIETSNVTAGATYGDSTFLLGTDAGALVHLNSDGTVIRSLDERNGLRLNAIRGISVRSDGNTFAFFDGGFVWLDLSDLRRTWDQTNGLPVAVKTIARDGAYVYAGTNAGLYRSLSGSRMRPINSVGTSPIRIAKVFRRSSIKNHNSLLLARSDGVFDLFDDQLTEITDAQPTALFISKTQPSRIAVGTKNSIRLFEFRRSKWHDVSRLGETKEALVSDFTETTDGTLLATYTNGTIKMFPADKWLGDGNLRNVVPISYQTFSRRNTGASNPHFVRTESQIYLFNTGPPVRWDDKDQKFTIDINLNNQITRTFGESYPAWYSTAHNDGTLWLQTNSGSHAISPSDNTTKSLPQSVDGTSEYNTVFIDEVTESVLFGTPDGITSMPATGMAERTLAQLNLRGASIDDLDIYQGEGPPETITLTRSDETVTLTFSVLDWHTKCTKSGTTISIEELDQTRITKHSVDNTCAVNINPKTLKLGESQLTAQMFRMGKPLTSPLTINFRVSKPWLNGSWLPLLFGLTISITILIFWPRSRRMWPKLIRRTLTLASGLQLALAVALIAEIIPPPISVTVWLLWFSGLAGTSLFLSVFSDALKCLSNNQFISRY